MRHDSTLGTTLPNTLRFLNERDLVAMGLVASVNTLRTWRAQNRGPRFLKVGRSVKYRLSDVEAFLNSLPNGGGAMQVAD